MSIKRYCPKDTKLWGRCLIDYESKYTVHQGMVMCVLYHWYTVHQGMVMCVCVISLVYCSSRHGNVCVLYIGILLLI